MDGAVLERVLERTHIHISPEAARAASEYNVPVEIIATAKADPAVVAEALAYAEHRELWDIASKTLDRARIIGVPVGVRALENGDLIVMFKSGAKILVPRPPELSTPKAILDYFSDYVLVTAERRNGKWTARTVKRIAGVEDVETAKAVTEELERAGCTPAPLCAAALALNYDPAVLEQHRYDILVRLLPAVNERVHAAYLSVPGVGKTHTAILYRHALGWAYYPKPPTPASLVGDARTGRLTAVRHDGVWLDEMDKWSKAENRERLAQAIEIMLTGLENCEWVREAGGSNAPRITKCVPFMFTGNVGPFAGPRGARATLTDIMRPVGDAAAQAFEERIAVVYVNQDPQANRIVEHALQGRTPRRAYVRGVFRLLRDRLLVEGGPVHGGARYKRHVENVRRTLRALGYDAEAARDEAGILVAGLVEQGGDGGERDG